MMARGEINQGAYLLIQLLHYTDKVTIKAWKQCSKENGYKIADDLTKVDLNEKQHKWREVNDLYSRGLKLRFSGG